MFEGAAVSRSRRLADSSLPQDWGRVREVVDAAVVLKEHAGKKIQRAES
jgi:hypothetical protein